MRWSIAFALALLSFAPALSAEPPPAPSAVSIASSTAPDGVRTLTHELVVPAGAEAVWEALTTAEGWKTWAVPLARPVAGKPDHFETSYNPQAAPGGPDTIEHQWLARQPPHTARFRTVRTPAGFPHAEAYKQVVSTFTLTPEGAGTRVRLVSTGYPAGEAGDALVGFFTDGNRMTLEALAGRFRDGAKDWGEGVGRLGGARTKSACPSAGWRTSPRSSITATRDETVPALHLQMYARALPQAVVRRLPERTTNWARRWEGWRGMWSLATERLRQVRCRSPAGGSTVEQRPWTMFQHAHPSVADPGY